MPRSARCGTCKYWSEMIAMIKAGTTVAMCLSQTSPQHGKYQPKWNSCEHHATGDVFDMDYVPPGQRQRSLDARAKLAKDEPDAP